MKTTTALFFLSLLWGQVLAGNQNIPETYLFESCPEIHEPSEELIKGYFERTAEKTIQIIDRFNLHSISSEKIKPLTDESACDALMDTGGNFEVADQYISFFETEEFYMITRYWYAVYYGEETLQTSLGIYDRNFEMQVWIMNFHVE